MHFLLSLPRHDKKKVIFGHEIVVPFTININKYTPWIYWEQNLKTMYQIRHFKCKIFVNHSIITHQESTRANSGQLGSTWYTTCESPGLIEGQWVLALLLTKWYNWNQIYTDYVKTRITPTSATLIDKVYIKGIDGIHCQSFIMKADI